MVRRPIVFYTAVTLWGRPHHFTAVPGLPGLSPIPALLIHPTPPFYVLVHTGVTPLSVFTFRVLQVKFVFLPKCFLFSFKLVEPYGLPSGSVSEAKSQASNVERDFSLLLW